jgi:hypothetical protein
MPFTQSNAPVRPVKEIQFGILSPEDIVRSASVNTRDQIDRILSSLVGSAVDLYYEIRHLITESVFCRQDRVS